MKVKGVRLFSAWIIIWVPWTIPIQALTPSSYLDSLNRGGGGGGAHSTDDASQPRDAEKANVKNNDNDDNDSPSMPFGMPPEEYYGHTNPMANNWPGSRHEEYGGYLKRLGPKQVTGNQAGKPAARSWSSSASSSEKVEAPDEWYGKSNPMASWEGYRHPRFGGYLDSLQKTGNEEGSSTSSNTSSSTLPAGKPSDYGNDVRWGAEVYLNSIQKDDGVIDDQPKEDKR